MIIGGANDWTCYGGSRMFYCEENKIKRFDLTKPQSFKFSLNNSYLDCGIVSAVYMIPLPQFPEQDYMGALYNDAQEIGFYTDSGPNSKRVRTELDIIETTPYNFQTTLHGK
jgi:hypothetical protein